MFRLTFVSANFWHQQDYVCALPGLAHIWSQKTWVIRTFWHLWADHYLQEDRLRAKAKCRDKRIRESIKSRIEDIGWRKLGEK